jgi:enoyl-CoA hydratase
MTAPADGGESAASGELVHGELVHGEHRGAVGVITLNRPRAINALTLEMVRAIDAHLRRFEADPAVAAIVLRGAGERGFCAGGDMVSVRAAALAGDPEAHRFFLEEYTLNARLGRCAKPIVALMEGLVLGGGVGLSGHVSHRLVTPSSKVGMPEVGIGFVPDVGATWLLSRAPGELGTHAALTGAHVGPHDAVALGLADRVVAPDVAVAVVDRLADGAPVDEVAGAAVALPREAAPLDEARDWIDRCYAGDDVAAIVARLRAEPSAGAAEAADLIATRSPTSLVVTLHALRRARDLATLEACLALEYSAVLEFIGTPDLHEGVRAALVDKDRAPRWQPSSLAEIDRDAVLRSFFRRFDDDQSWVETFTEALGGGPARARR